MGMSVGSGGGEDKPMGEMNTTPLIDVMLVLLIIFLINIPVQTHAVKIDLPPPSNNPNNDIKPIFNMINIDANNVIYWNGNPSTKEQIKSYLRQVGDMPQEDQPELRLRPDALSKYEIVDEVMAYAQQADIKRMGFVGNEAYADM